MCLVLYNFIRRLSSHRPNRIRRDVNLCDFVGKHLLRSSFFMRATHFFFNIECLSWSRNLHSPASFILFYSEWWIIEHWKRYRERVCSILSLNIYTYFLWKYIYVHDFIRLIIVKISITFTYMRHILTHKKYKHSRSKIRMILINYIYVFHWTNWISFPHDSIPILLHVFDFILSQYWVL